MKRLGFPQEAINTVWTVLAAVLNLGNLQFESGENEGTEIGNKDVLKKVGSLLDVSSMQELEESLTGRVIAAHGEVVRKLHNKDDALRARDAFAKVSLNLLCRMSYYLLCVCVTFDPSIHSVSDDVSSYFFL